MRPTSAGGLMARKKGRPKKPTGQGLTCRVDSDLVKKGRYIATERGMSLTEVFSEILRPVVEREFKKLGRDLMDEGE